MNPRYTTSLSDGTQQIYKKHGAGVFKEKTTVKGDYGVGGKIETRHYL